MNEIPKMTWAQMARAEGHRKKHPNSPSRSGGNVRAAATEDRMAMVMQFLRRNGPAQVAEIAVGTDISPRNVMHTMRTLRKDGSVTVSGHPNRLVYTAAGEQSARLRLKAAIREAAE